MALAMVTSVINGFVAQNQVARVADHLINTGPLGQHSAKNPSSSSSEERQRIRPDNPHEDAIQINRQKLIEPLAEPSQFCLRATHYLRFDGNPCSAFLVDCNTSGLLAEADRLILTSGVREPTPDSRAARLVKPIDELQQTMVQAIGYRNSQYVALFSLASDWGQQWLDEESPRKNSLKSKLAGAVSRPGAQRQSDAKAEQLLASTQITQSDSLDRNVLQIRVENPQSALQKNPRIAMYAAGIAVLFLLFSSTGNAATLLEESESGTLDRIMVGKAKIFHIIFGKWLGIFFMGIVQISVMFLWADLVFQIQLWKHWDGFSLMTCCTSAATASLAILMATICRSRAQLNAISVVLILSMSAMGGSMIPRFAMSDRMKEIGQWTFNAWALDGYQKVFWYQAPIPSLMIEVTVLIGSALVMGCLALIFSQRWKCA
jgi:ABC-type multidrug transport system permease subunit